MILDSFGKHVTSPWDEKTETFPTRLQNLVTKVDQGFTDLVNVSDLHVNYFTLSGPGRTPFKQGALWWLKWYSDTPIYIFLIHLVYCEPEYLINEYFLCREH